MGKDAQYQRLAMKIFADFSGSIAIPAVGAAFLGKWLDARYGTSPKLIILCLLVAFVLTATIIVRKARKYSAAYNSIDKTV
jgi:F0F1-type ATP synthase assembly protein I